MKKPPLKSRPSIAKHLSPEELAHHIAVRRRTSEGRGDPRPKFVAKRAPRSLMLAASIALAVSTPLLAAEPTGAAALLAQANAEAQAGHSGPAILHYERAAWLAPRDNGIARQLATAREQAGLPATRMRAATRLTHTLSFDALTALASICLLLLCFLVFGTRLIPWSLRRAARGLAAAFGVVAMSAAICIGARWPELQRAVVMSTGAEARVAPAESAALSFELKAGEVICAGRAYGKFVRVRAVDGRIGWVPGAQIAKIIPTSA